MCWGHVAGGIGATVFKKRRNTIAGCNVWGVSSSRGNHRGELPLTRGGSRREILAQCEEVTSNNENSPRTEQALLVVAGW